MVANAAAINDMRIVRKTSDDAGRTTLLRHEGNFSSDDPHVAFDATLSHREHEEHEAHEHHERYIPLWDGWKKHFDYPPPPIFSTLCKRMSKRISAIT